MPKAHKNYNLIYDFIKLCKKKAIENKKKKKWYFTSPLCLSSKEIEDNLGLITQEICKDSKFNFKIEYCVKDDWFIPAADTYLYVKAKRRKKRSRQYVSYTYDRGGYDKNVNYSKKIKYVSNLSYSSNSQSNTDLSEVIR